LDEDALVARFWGRILVFARQRVATAVEGEDVAQETMRRVLEAVRQGRLRAPEALPSFVFETARNVCRQRHRSDARRGRAVDRLRRWLSHADLSVDPVGEITSERNRETVRKALTQLAEDDRELLRMSFYEALDTTEVARRLDVTAGTLRVRRFRALQRLRAILEASKCVTDD
jgi:RNA polymerase sigma-70 factor (ECF subfamily)